MLGTPQTLRTALAAETDHEYALRRFRFTLVSPATVFSATGTSNDDVLAADFVADTFYTVASETA